MIDYSICVAEQRIKGMILKGRLQFLEKTFGPASLLKVLAFLKGKTRDVMSDPKNIRATGWYEFTINTELDKAIFKAFGNGDEKLYKQMGGFSNEFQDSVSSLEYFSSPWKYLRMQANSFPRFWDPGRLELIEVKTSGDCEAIYRFHDVRSTRENCLTNIGFVEKGLQMCGAKDIKVWETQCTEDLKVPYCEFHMTFKWTPRT
jgi:hypothetical protein